MKLPGVCIDCRAPVVWNGRCWRTPGRGKGSRHVSHRGRRGQTERPSLTLESFGAPITGVTETPLIGAPSMNRTTPCHAHECTRCGGPTHEPVGAILERLYPSSLFCDGCGRLAVRCECVA